jgi:2-keto-4-pentenoate hydratase/2-oxohepta-3-ene-1,7-dioic acid hydratase in catechol pathway
MRLVTFSLTTTEQCRLGMLADEHTVIDLAAALRDVIDIPATLLGYIAAGPAFHAAVIRHVAAAPPWPATVRFGIQDLVLHAPLRPGKIVGVGLNYVEHVEESSRALDTDQQRPERPVLFSKPATAVIGPNQPILHDSRLTAQLDWECELAAVIGSVAHAVDEDHALGHIFGYSIMNDISARDQRRSGQWFFSKGQDSYAPFGPVVVTSDEIPDPHELTLSLDVNGEQRQHGNTRNMLFTIPELIADITSGMTLEPGDVISTGSPQGVGAAMTPPTYLQPGDIVSAHIERIGTLSNPVKAV